MIFHVCDDDDDDDENTIQHDKNPCFAQIIETVIILFAIVFNKNLFKLNLMVGNAKKRKKKEGRTMAIVWHRVDFEQFNDN